MQYLQEIQIAGCLRIAETNEIINHVCQFAVCALSRLAAALAVGNSAAQAAPFAAYIRVTATPCACPTGLTQFSFQSCGWQKAWHMDLTWILLCLVGWGLGLLFVLALMRMAGDQDRAARHEQKRVDPNSDVTITQFGSPPEAGGQ
jgi:hypothetical protein